MGNQAVIITGAGGFLGRRLVDAYRTEKTRVGAIGHGLGDISADAAIEADISAETLEALANQLGAVDALIHCAGGSSVGASLADPARDFQRTVGSTSQALRFIQQHAPKARFVLTSSAAVYGSGHDGAIAEGAALAPVSPYGAHKAAAEALTRGWAAAYGVDAVVLRFFSIYGAGLRKQLLWELSQRVFRGESKPLLFGFGDEKRDFIEADDAVRLIQMAADPSLRPPLLLNAGSGVSRTVRDVASALVKACGGDDVAFNGDVKPGDPRSLVADTAALRAFGFAPGVDFADGIQRYADWARRQTVS